MASPFVYLRSSVDGNSEVSLFKAVFDGDLGRIKGIIKNLGIGNGNRAAVFSFIRDGFGVLHLAACLGHLEVCKYLVEELGGDANMTGDEGVTVFMASAQSGDVYTVKYFLDHGGDLMKTDEKGLTVLHHTKVWSGA
ncbi:hypothetical protein ACP4OV_007855 [Aristida adscensionis]